jgi:AcrR family transcriptional regulator
MSVREVVEKSVDRGALEARILAVATDLFIRHGYKGVSYLSIAKELGIGHSLVHYYFRTKSLLAATALDAYVARTKSDFRGIWTDPHSSLLTRFVRSRDWIWRQYVLFNPDGVGTQTWGLLSVFAGESDALTPAMRKTIRLSLEEMDSFIGTGIMLAIRQGALSAETPVHELVLQISSLLHTSRQIIRFEGTFQRLDDLLRWTLEVIVRAYGAPGAYERWPAVQADSPDRTAKRLNVT